MLKLSDEAVNAIREMTTDGALRFSAEETDGEVELDIAAVEEPTDGDKLVERDGARVYLDPVAAEALSDQTLDVEPHGDHVHFTFVPQDEQ